MSQRNKRIKMRIDGQTRQQVRESIVEGCRAMREVMLDLEREFKTADEELWRAIESATPERLRSSGED